MSSLFIAAIREDDMTTKTCRWQHIGWTVLAAFVTSNFELALGQHQRLVAENKTTISTDDVWSVTKHGNTLNRHACREEEIQHLERLLCPARRTRQAQTQQSLITRHGNILNLIRHLGHL